MSAMETLTYLQDICCLYIRQGRLKEPRILIFLKELHSKLLFYLLNSPLLPRLVRVIIKDAERSAEFYDENRTALMAGGAMIRQCVRSKMDHPTKIYFYSTLKNCMAAVRNGLDLRLGECFVMPFDCFCIL
ncbi:unnamed protein product [Lathyrus sativus]|nr:unnamed protein product [Lathyrus sativus]